MAATEEMMRTHMAGQSSSLSNVNVAAEKSHWKQLVERIDPADAWPQANFGASVERIKQVYLQAKGNLSLK